MVSEVMSFRQIKKSKFFNKLDNLEGYLKVTYWHQIISPLTVIFNILLKHQNSHLKIRYKFFKSNMFNNKRFTIQSSVS